jgi:hypothetical protein
MQVSILKPIFVGGLVITVLSQGFSKQNPQWKGTIIQENGISIIKNPKEPLYHEKIVSLKKDLTIGGAKAQGDAVLASARSLAVDDRENIYILDAKDSAIIVFDRTGTFIRKFGQKGQGPGDLDRPSQIAIDQSKNALMILNGSLGLSFFAYDGTFIKNISTEDAKRAQYAKADSQGNIVLNSIRIQDMDHRWDVLKKYEPEAAAPAEIKSTILGSPYDLLMPMAYWDIDDKDNIYYGFPKAYEIEIFNAQNKLAKKILRDYTPVEPSAELKSRISLAAQSYPPDIAAKAYSSKVHSAFNRFMIDEQGRLYVANWEQNGKEDVYDVFDPDGRYIAKFALPRKSILFKKGKLYSIEEDGDGYQNVTRYVVNWLTK